MKKEPAGIRFERYIHTEPNTGCWLWGAGILSAGYGEFWDGRSMSRAHKFSWEFYRGPVPEGLEVAHTCDVRWCVNPDHLFLATHAQNMADMKNKGRQSHGAAHGDGIRGSLHGMAKLKESDISMIHEMVKRGATNVATAARFGVSPSMISNIRHRKNWVHAALDDKECP